MPDLIGTPCIECDDAILDHADLNGCIILNDERIICNKCAKKPTVLKKYNIKV